MARAVSFHSGTEWLASCLPEISLLATAAPLPRATKRASAATIVAGCLKLLMALRSRRKSGRKLEVKRRAGRRIYPLRTVFPTLWPNRSFRASRSFGEGAVRDSHDRIDVLTVRNQGDLTVYAGLAGLKLGRATPRSYFPAPAAASSSVSGTGRPSLGWTAARCA